MEMRAVDAATLDSSSVNALLETHRRKNLPLVVRNGCSQWPAVRNWNLDYLRAKGTDEKAQCMIFGGVTPLGVELPVAEAIERIKAGANLYISQAAVYVRASGGRRPALPDLMSDCEMPATTAGGSTPASLELFVGRKTYASMHYHHAFPGSGLCTEALKAQIVGTKAALLFSPATDLAAFRVFNHNFSRISFKDWPTAKQEIIRRHPLVARAVPYEVVLQPGDMLFIPSYWWHSLFGDELSISATAFWQDREPDEAAGLRESVNYRRCEQVETMHRYFGSLHGLAAKGLTVRARARAARALRDMPRTS